MLVEDCPKEKEPGLLALEAAPKTLALVDVGVEEAAWPKTGAELKLGWLKEKPLAGLPAACPKAGACPKAVCPKTVAGAEAPNAGLPNAELLAWGVAAAVLLVTTCPNTGVPEGAVAVLLGGWLNAELALAAEGCVKTEEPEVAVPNTAVSVAEAGAPLEAVLEVLGVADASMAPEPAPGRTAAPTAACPGPAKVEAGDTASVLLSGPPGAIGGASVDATRLAADAGGLGLLSAVCTRTGSFLTGSEVCREAWGGWVDCGCTGREGADAETSPWPDFSGTADGVASSVLLPEDTGRGEADVELKRPPNDKVGKDDVREGATEVTVGAADAAALLVCGLPNEKPTLLDTRDGPAKLTSPEGPALLRGRPPKTGAEGVLVLTFRGAAGAASAGAPEDGGGTVGSTGFPTTGALEKLNPEGLAGWTPARLVDEALLTGFEESSAWPTRSPEKLPSVSPARELGNRSSPSLDTGASTLLAAADTGIPEGAAGLLLAGAESPGEAVVTEVLGADVGPVGGEPPGMVSQKGLPPPPNENVSGWFDSFVGGATPGVAVRLEDGVGVIVPKVKAVPDGANEKGLLSCPTADGVEVTADSVLAVPEPAALSPEDE